MIFPGQMRKAEGRRLNNNSADIPRALEKQKKKEN
jgi:hypothetical protein